MGGSFVLMDAEVRKVGWGGDPHRVRHSSYIGIMGDREGALEEEVTR